MNLNFYELKRFPFPQPDDFSNPKEKWAIVHKVAKFILNTKTKIEHGNILERKSLIDKAKETIRKYVYEYYEIASWEENLIDDTMNVFAESATPASLDSKKLRTLESSTSNDREQYANLFCKAINSWCRRSAVKLNAETYIAKHFGLALFVLKQKTEQKGYMENKSTSGKFFEVLRMINESLQDEAGTRLLMQKRYVHFEEDRAYIIKPLELRYWTQPKISTRGLTASRHRS